MRSLARRHPVATFLVLAYAISWAAWLPLVVQGARVRQGEAWPTHLPGLMGAAVAALVTLALVSGRPGVADWLRRIVRWRIPLWCYLLSAGTLALGLAVAWLEPGALAGTSSFGGVPDLGLLATFLLVLVVNGVGEEAGWRGYLADSLVPRHGLVLSSAIVASAWALWHLPLFVVMDSFRSMGMAVAGWVLGLLAGSIVLTWLYVGSGRSILAVALFHTAYNFTSGTEAADGAAGVVTSMAVVVVAAILAARAGRTVRPESVVTR